MSETIYHIHHIIPKHAGGSDDASNLIRLTIQEHADAHRKLWETHRRWQDKLAWLCLSGKSTEAEEYRRLVASEYMSNRTVSTETKQRMSDSHLGVQLSENHRRAISNGLVGRPVSAQTRAKLKSAFVGKKRPQSVVSKMRAGMLQLPTIMCNHCGLTTRNVANLARHTTAKHGLS